LPKLKDLKRKVKGKFTHKIRGRIEQHSFSKTTPKTTIVPVQVTLI